MLRVYIQASGVYNLHRPRTLSTIYCIFLTTDALLITRALLLFPTLENTFKNTITLINKIHDMMSKSGSVHVRSLTESVPFFESEQGSMRRVTAEELPILKNLSIKRLALAPGAIREPHCKFIAPITHRCK